MHLNIRSSIWMLLICGSIATLSASPPVIGVARSRGAIVINNASVPGTATILDGTSLSTTGMSSDVRLKTGQRLTLGSGSAATIYQDRLVLQSGMAELDRASAYRVEARGLRIGSSNPEGSVRVIVFGSRQVQVAATAGTAEVRNPKGVLVARVLPGTALQLHAAAEESTSITGRIQQQGDKFFLTDETTHVTTELRGEGLADLVGKRVQITGKAIPGEAPMAGASQVVAVTNVAVLGTAAAAGGAAAGAAVSSGLSATTIAIIGGAAAAGTLGGLAAAGTFSGDDDVSR